MYSTHGHVRLIFAAVFITSCVGCNQPEQRSTLGNLPGPRVGDTDQGVNATTYFAHAHLLERQGQFERATVQYRNALSRQPDFLSARNRLGITLNKLGRHGEATAEFLQAIADHPGLAYLHNNLGFSLYLEGKYADAKVAFEQALELKPDFARAHMNYALALARLGEHDQAFTELKQVGSESDACFNMGMMLTEAGHYADAAQYLESALALRPNFDAARQQLREVSRLAAEREAREAALATANPPSPEPAIEETPETPESVAGDVAANEPAAEHADETITPEKPPVAAAEPSVDPVPYEAVATDTSIAEPEPLASTTDTDSETWVDPFPTALDDDPEWEPLVLAAGPDTPPWNGSPTDETDSETTWASNEPGIDAPTLFALIEDAITAFQNQSDDLDSIWCQVGYYLFPETAPENADVDFGK